MQRMRENKKKAPKKRLTKMNVFYIIEKMFNYASHNVFIRKVIIRGGAAL